MKRHFTFKAIQKLDDTPTYRLMPDEWKDTGWRASLEGKTKKRWMVYNESKSRVIVDYPVVYQNGDIGWDNPYAIPDFVAKRFHALINLVKDAEVKS